MHADGNHAEGVGFVSEFVSGCLGRPVDAAVALTPGELSLVFRSLSRADEIAKPRRLGERLTWTAEDYPVAERSTIAVPRLDDMVAEVGRRLPNGGPRLSPWPGGKPFAICLSHDMDHVTAFIAPERWRSMARSRAEVGGGFMSSPASVARACKATVGDFIKRNVLGRRDPFGNVGDWLKIEADNGFKSSLYFFAETIRPSHPFDCSYGFSDRVSFEGHATTVGRMMREIAGRGWEVGVHGSIASATVEGVLATQKAEVESVIGRPSYTTRQHYLQYHPVQTPVLQSRAGITADGTHGFNDCLGFRAGTSFPYRTWDWSSRKPLPMLQLPLHVQDGPLFRLAGTIEAALSHAMGIMDEVQRVGGCLGVLFHPLHLSTARGLAVYKEILQEARRRGAWGCTMHEAATRWLDHVESLRAKPHVAA